MARLPLCDIPLERFLPSSSNICDTSNPFGSSAPLKRPLSPTGRQDTPNAKRRMVAKEKDRSMASPRSSKATARSRYGQPSMDFGAILRGPDSPARRLDFSSPTKSTQCQDAMDVTPRPRTRAAAHADVDMTPVFSQQPNASSSSSSGNGLAAAQSHHPIVYNLVPRSLPPLQESASEHFPGFYICPDPYTLEAAVDETQLLEEQVRYDEEPEKENDKPPREIHGLSTLSLDSPTKPTSAFSMSVIKNKTSLPHHTSYVSMAHRRIFGVHSAVMEDALDLGASDSFARRAALASDLLCFDRNNDRQG
ncbi:hypothetical protein BKA70DRAFT_1257845 [Coprinopsis sp. MPI-PUGE-AT-0042]|nr:hypothetical protein BKA70DRAFT_1257845 [Coprinopsis sp. MPI-PUGE-AT-0042]